jgi:hypothetical protein
MLEARALLGVLMSAAALGVVACGSDDGAAKPPASTQQDATCNSIGLECMNSNNFDMVLCRNEDGTKLWYLVCTDAECKSGTRFDCNGTDCSDAAKPATDACNPNQD